MSKDTSAPAFPRTSGTYHQGAEGMTMRQYAAIMAMQGILTNPDGRSAISVAIAAVACADALLAELEK